MNEYYVQLTVRGPWIPAVAMDDNLQWFDITGVGARHRTEIVARRLRRLA